jgi:hypothetical protein
MLIKNLIIGVVLNGASLVAVEYCCPDSVVVQILRP